jgi:DNA-binding LytR/AlgR family response regulator
LLLLDIEMPGLDGLAVAATRDLPPVVFITAHEEHALAAFGVRAVDYLLKPVRAPRLADALERVRERIARPMAVRVSARNGATVQLFDARDVTRFSASHKYTVFRVDGVEHLAEEPLSALGARLAAIGFIRVHRAELVRASAIRVFTATTSDHHVVLEDGQVVPVSRRYAAAVKQHLVDCCRRSR